MSDWPFPFARFIEVKNGHHIKISILKIALNKTHFSSRDLLETKKSGLETESSRFIQCCFLGPVKQLENLTHA